MRPLQLSGVKMSNNDQLLALMQSVVEANTTRVKFMENVDQHVLDLIAKAIDPVDQDKQPTHSHPGSRTGRAPNRNRRANEVIEGLRVKTFLILRFMILWLSDTSFE